MIMRKILIILFTLINICAYSQTIDSLILNTKYGPTDPDLMFYFRTNNIDLYKINISNKVDNTSKFTLVSTEVSNGEISKRDTIFSWVDNKSFILGKNMDLSFNVLTQDVKTDSVRFSFDFKNYSTYTYFSKINTNTYSLRDGLLSSGENVKIGRKGVFPILVYSLPYEDPKKPGYLFYCKLTGENINPKDWYANYGIKHYIIFDLIVE